MARKIKGVETEDVGEVAVADPNNLLEEGDMGFPDPEDEGPEIADTTNAEEEGDPADDEPDAPAETPVGSLPITDLARAEHLREIEEAELKCANREAQMLADKESLKESKEAFEVAVAELRSIIRRKVSSPGPLFEQFSPSGVKITIEESAPDRKPLVWEEQDGEKWGAVAFNGNAWRIRKTTTGTLSISGAKFDADASDGALLPDEWPGDWEYLSDAQAWCEERDEGLWLASASKVNEDAGKRPEDDSWKSVTLESIGIKPAILAKLAEHKPALTTMGELAAWTSARSNAHGGNNEIIDVAGIGAGKAKEVQEALDKFWFTTWPNRAK